MLPLSRIVVPTDFSDRCRGMLRYVKVITARYGAELTLLHVVNPVYEIPATGISGPAIIAVPQSVIAEQTEKMAEFGRDDLHGLEVRRLVYQGDPEEQIVRFVESEGIDLLAMPTHGSGVLRRFLIGSVTAKVLHDVACPVLTGVHMEEVLNDVPVTLSSVLCAVDLGGQSRQTLAWAVQFAKDFDASLSVVHAVPALSRGAADVANQAREQLEKLLAAVGADASDIYILEGEPVTTVCSFAKSSGADLLVIGRGLQDGPAGRLRTNAYAIIRESPCPVISI